MLAAPWPALEKVMRFFAPLLLAAGFAVFAPPAALAQNIVGMFGEDSGALRIQLDSPAPPDGLTATVGLACDDAGGVSVGGNGGAQVDDFTVAGGGAPDIRPCARVWEVAIAPDASEAVFAPNIAASESGRLIEFFLADPPAAASDAVFRIDDSARYVAVVRGLSASFAAENPRVVVEGQSATLTIALSGAVDFPGAAVSVVVSGNAADPADYTLDGLSGGGVAVADDASEAAFTVNTKTDSASEGVGGNVVPHEAAIFEISDSHGSGFAVGDSGAAMTLLIADAGAHSPIVFDPAGADAAEGDSVILALSFNALPIGFRITLTGADAADNGDWSFVGGGCAPPPTANQCVIAIAADAVAAEVAIAVAADGEAELAEELGLMLLGDAPPGYVWGGDFMLTIAVSDVNAVDGAGNSALMRAARAGDADAVEAWIAAGADVNAKNTIGDSALILAVLFEHAAVVEKLVNAPGIDVNATNRGGDTALILAVALAVDFGPNDVVNKLLAAGDIALDAQDSGGDTALDLANANYQDNIRALLIARAAPCNNECEPGDVNLQGEAKRGTTELHIAARDGDVDEVIGLLMFGRIQINAQDAAGYTALDWANNDGWDDVGDALRADGARCSRSCADGDMDLDGEARGRTALHTAAENGDAVAVDRLLTAGGIDINAKDAGGYTALMWAAQRGRDAAVMRLIQESGIIDAAARNDRGATALMLAAANGRDAVAGFLLDDGGADVNAHDLDGYTALILAASNGHSAMVGLLRAAAGIDLNARDDDNWTALIWAAWNGRAAAVGELLMAAGVAVDAQSNAGLTALDYANRGGHEDVRTALLGKSARCSVICRTGDTRLDGTIAP